MSKLISDEKEFLYLLLTTTKEQKRALLYTITKRQVQAISEVAHNLLNLPLKQSVGVIIERRRKTLQKIGNKKFSVRTRSSLIKKHMTQLLDTFQLVKSQLEQVIE